MHQPTIEISGLRTLHKKMVTSKIQHQKFRVTTGAVAFECLFSAPPFQLSLTSRGSQRPEFFLFKILPGYRIKTLINSDDFKRLMALLKTHGQSNSKFSSLEWFTQISCQVPQIITKEPTPKEICTLRNDLEEPEKPYWDTWIQWTDGRKPSKNNLQKTRLLLGDEAYRYSLKMGFSTKWSSTDLGRHFSLD